MSHEHDVCAFIPDRFGLSVVDVAQLLDYLIEGQALEEAITNASFDSVDGYWSSERFAAHVQRLRALNDTGDATAYWDTE